MELMLWERAGGGGAPGEGQGSGGARAQPVGGYLAPPYSRCPGVRRRWGSAQGQEELAVPGISRNLERCGRAYTCVCVYFAEPAWKIMSVYMRTSVCEHLANICITARGCNWLLRLNTQRHLEFCTRRAWGRGRAG